MQGFVFYQFQEYVQQSFGLDVWSELIEEVGVQGKNYTLFTHYPTAEFKALVQSLSKHTKRPFQDILEDFGIYAAPKVWQVCKEMIPSRWSLTDLLLNITDFTHHLLARAVSGTHKLFPIRSEKTSQDEITLHYELPHTMCAMSKGLIRGLATLYGTKIAITESDCQVIFSILRNPS